MQSLNMTIVMGMMAVITHTTMLRGRFRHMGSTHIPTRMNLLNIRTRTHRISTIGMTIKNKPKE
jgi:hypothetical protein